MICLLFTAWLLLLLNLLHFARRAEFILSPLNRVRRYANNSAYKSQKSETIRKQVRAKLKLQICRVHLLYWIRLAVKGL